MANIGYSFLKNGLVYIFNPATDTLTFDVPGLSAAEVNVFENGRVIFNSTTDNKLVGLTVSGDVPVFMKHLTTLNILFSDGSKLLIGDNTISTSEDDDPNALTGGTKDDHLIGLGGNDTLIGSGGNDLLEGGSGNDRLDGGEGGDVFLDSRGANLFLGRGGNDFFFAQGPSSTVDGGADTATGGTGRDTYYANSSAGFYPVVDFTVTDFAATATTGDIINIATALFQAAAAGSYEGEDPVTGGFVSVVQSGEDALVKFDFGGSGETFFQPQTVLKLLDTSATAAAGTIGGYLIGGAEADTLTGGASNEFLWGGAANDTLNGGMGADYLLGGAGNDTYYVDIASDAVKELSAADGTADVVIASVNFSLESVNHVENLKLVGDVAKEGTGNALNNSITGNALANVLKGLAGNDVLSGGTGTDTMLGGAGDDKLIWGTGDQANGEAGTDTLKVAGNVNLDLTTLINTQILVEKIDMIGGTNTLTLNKADVMDLSSETNTITILGNAADKVDIVGTFTRGAIADGFRTYSLGGGIRLLVETDVQVI